MMTKLKIFVPSAVLITCLCFLIYLVTQQTIRLSVNAFPHHVASDIASKLTANQDITPSLPTHIDLATSSSLFVMVFDAQGALATSTATLDNQPPSLPQGVLYEAAIHKQHTLTWQPKEGVREAIWVISLGDKGYVLAGQSLLDAEQLEDTVLRLTIMGGIGTLILTGIATVLFVPTPKKKRV